MRNSNSESSSPSKGLNSVRSCDLQRLAPRTVRLRTVRTVRLQCLPDIISVLCCGIISSFVFWHGKRDVESLRHQVFCHAGGIRGAGLYCRRDDGPDEGQINRTRRRDGEGMERPVVLLGVVATRRRDRAAENGRQEGSEA